MRRTRLRNWKHYTDCVYGWCGVFRAVRGLRIVVEVHL